MKINELVLKNRFVVENDPVAPVADPAAAPAAATTPTAPKPPAAAPAAKGPGLWDKLKAGVAGAKASYTSSQAQRAGIEKGQKIGTMYIDQWNKAIGQNPALNTAENLQAFMQNSTKKSGIKVPPPPAGELNPAVTSKYIIDVVSQSLAAGSLGLPSERQDDTVPQQPQGPQQAAQPAAPQQAAADSTATTATSTDPAAMDRLVTITQPKSFASGTQVPVTKVTQQPSTVATTQNADELIANAKSAEELEAMLAALEGPQA